jgi:hypothetical protein
MMIFLLNPVRLAKYQAMFPFVKQLNRNCHSANLGNEE